MPRSIFGKLFSGGKDLDQLRRQALRERNWKELEKIELSNSKGTIEIDNLKIPAGTYIYQLTSGDYRSAKKMVIVR